MFNIPGLSRIRACYLLCSRYLLALLAVLAMASALSVTLSVPLSANAQQDPALQEQVLYAQVSEDPSPLSPVVINGEPSVVSTDRVVMHEKNGAITGLGHLSGLQRSTEASHGVLVQLSKPPLLAAAILRKSGGGHIAQAQISAVALSKQITLEHEKARGLLLPALTAKGAQISSTSGASPKITREFSTAFNGFAVSGITIAAAQAALASMPGISVFPDVTVRASLSESVKIIRASEVWQPAQGLGLDGTGTTIGIIDTGVDYTHPDLGGCFGVSCKVVGGYDFVNNDPNPMDDHGHGTHVAATAAGNGTYRDSNGVSHPLPGVAPGAKIYAYKVLSASGSGSTSGIIAAIERCTDPNLDGNFLDHLDVCSLSLGSSGNPDDPTSLAIDLASKNGVVFTVAAGNSGPAAGTLDSPGTSREAITVAAACKPGWTTGVCQGSSIATFSSRGPIPNFPQVLKPDVAAPGVDICAARFGSFASGSECKDTVHIAISGTSMATPHVAGLAAIIRQANPSLTPADVKAIIIGTASDLGAAATAQGAGMIDAVAAVAAAGQPYTFLRFHGRMPVVSYTPIRLVQELSTSVTVVNTSGADLSISPSVLKPVAGVSISFPAGQISLLPDESRTIPIVVAVDHRVAVARSLSVLLKFTTPLGDATIPLVLDIKSPLSLSATKLDLGISLPEQPNFSVTHGLTLSNSIIDSDWTYSISGSSWSGERGETSRFSTALSASSVTVPAGGSITVSVTTSASGAPGSSGLNSSLLQITGGVVSASVPISVWQGYALHLSYGASTPWYVELASRQPRPGLSMGEDLDFIPNAGAASTTIYVRTSGQWDIASYFLNESPAALILKTVNLAGAETPVETAYREATLSLVAKVPRTKGYMFHYFAFTPKMGGRDMSANLLWIDYRGGNSFPLAINPISSDWVFSATTLLSPRDNDDPLQPPVLLHFRRESGFSESFEMDPGPLKPYLVNAVSHVDPLAPLELTAIFGIKKLLRNGMVVDLGIAGSVFTTPAGQVPMILASGYHDVAPSAESAADLPFFSLMVGNIYTAEIQGPSITFTRDGAFTYDEDRFIQLSHYMKWEHPYTYAPRGYFGPRMHSLNRPDILTVGVGPLTDTSRWYNVGASTATLVPRIGLTSSFYSYGGSSKARGFLTSYGDSFVEPSPKYLIKRNGAAMNSGSLREGEVCPDHYKWSCLSLGRSLHQLTPPKVYGGAVIAGRYEVQLSREVKINGVDTSVTTTGEFSIPTAAQHQTSPIDENPPSLRELRSLVDGIWQTGIDPTKTNRIEFTLDPNPGLGALVNIPGELHHAQLPDSVQDIRFSQSADRISWQEIPLESLSDERFASEVSIQAASSLYHFRIEASDSSGNRFSYTFSLPTVTARSFKNPASLPLSATLDSIPNNTPYSQSDVIPVTVRGQTVILGSRVEVIVNDKTVQLTPFASAKGGVLTYIGELPLSQLPLGPVSIKARITDPTGRQAVSDPQSFVIALPPLSVTLHSIYNSTPYSPSDVISVTAYAQNVIPGSIIEVIANDKTIQLAPLGPIQWGSLTSQGELNLSDLTLGPVSIKARITDPTGRQAVSDPQSFVIALPPLSVTLDSILNNAPYPPFTILWVTAFAQNVIPGSIIEVIANDKTIQLAPLAPIQGGRLTSRGELHLSELTPGPVSIKARITDPTGRQAVSDSQSFVIAPHSGGGNEGGNGGENEGENGGGPGKNALSLSISHPSRLVVSRRLVFTVTPSGPAINSLRNVSVMANGKAACRFSSAPYICSWKIPRTPRHSLRLRARAVDQNGTLIRSRVTRMSIRH